MDKKQPQHAPAVDDLQTAFKKLRVNFSSESRRVTPGLQKHHHHHHHYHNHLSAPVRKFRSRSASTSVPEGSMEQKLATVSEQLEQARLEPRLEPSLPAPPCPVPACPPTVCSAIKTPTGSDLTCSQQARMDDTTVDELAGYFDNLVYIPRKMSVMAEMMYT